MRILCECRGKPGAIIDFVADKKGRPIAIVVRTDGTLEHSKLCDVKVISRTAKLDKFVEALIEESYVEALH